MRLTGACSNQETADVLEALLDRKRQLALGADGTDTGPKRPLRLPKGAIQAAVLQVLDAATGPLRLGEIHSRVEQRLDRATTRDTVSSFLSVACRADNPTVVRAGYGLYRIAR